MSDSPLILPFTNHRLFHDAPRQVVAAKGVYYTKDNGDKLLDGTSGLWCVNAGHSRAAITKAIAAQTDTLDYAPAFQMGHPVAFDLAERLSSLMPPPIHHLMFVSSGSEAVESALKLALYDHRLRHPAFEGAPLVIARQRSYHGVCWGGVAVGGIVNNRLPFERWTCPAVEFVRAFDDIPQNLMQPNFPPHGGIERADDVLAIIEKHGRDAIAAVIMEPVSGSAGVLVPPKGYLQRVNEICQSHDIPLILDEVITAFGRLGDITASSRFHLKPDIICCAKGLTNGTVPMGMVGVSRAIMDTIRDAAPHPYQIEFPHGFTYSGHPLACAAADATLTVYETEELFVRSRELESFFADAVHSLRDLPAVHDIRSIGMMAAIELHPQGHPSQRAFDLYHRLFHKGFLVRTTGDTIALSPPLIIEKEQIEKLIENLRNEIAAS